MEMFSVGRAETSGDYRVTDQVVEDSPSPKRPMRPPSVSELYAVLEDTQLKVTISPLWLLSSKSK